VALGGASRGSTPAGQRRSDLQDEQAHFEALLDEIGEANMTQPGVTGDWSIKDIVAHLTSWRRRTVASFQAALRHESSFSPPWPPNLEEADEINTWIYDANKDRPLTDVLEESHAVFAQLVATLSAFPEAELLEPNRFDWLEGEPMSAAAFFEHFHEEHEPEMQAWLDQIISP
jgi:hypothetical protein